MLRSDQYKLAKAGDDDVMTKNVTSNEESTIQRLSERHVAVIITTTSLLTLIMLIIVVVIVVRHRRCQSLSFSPFFPIYLYIYRDVIFNHDRKGILSAINVVCLLLGILVSYF